eukprot:g35928.t1
MKSLFESPADWWETVKGNIKRFFILKGVQKMREKWAKLSKLQKIMQNLLLLQMMGVNIMKDLQEVKSQKMSFFTSEASNIIFWSRVCIVKQDETLYDTKPTDSTASLSFLSSIMEVLDNRMLERLDQLLSRDKLTKALESLKKNKTHRNNSLLAELYLALWDLLGEDLLEPFAESIRKDVSLRGVTIPGSRGLQVKTSLYMDNVAVFCSDPLSVHGPMSICNQLELASDAKINQGKNEAMFFGNLVDRSFSPFSIRTDYLKVTEIWFQGAGTCTKSWEECITTVKQKLVLWEHYSLSIVGNNLVNRCEVRSLLSMGLASLPQNAPSSWAIPHQLSFVEKFAKKNIFDHKSIRKCSAHRVLKTLQEKERNKELTSTECCRLVHSKVQDYVLRDTKRDTVAAKLQWGKTTIVQMLYKMVSKPPVVLTYVEDATSEAADAIDHVVGCAGLMWK